MNTEKNTLLGSIFEKLSIIEKKQEPVQELELAEEVKEEVKEEVVEAVKEELAEVKEKLSEVVDEPKFVTEDALNAKITELSELIKDMAAKFEVKETELTEQVVELSKEPAAKAIVHSPESEGVDNGMKYQFGASKPQGTRNRVMDRISNLK